MEKQFRAAPLAALLVIAFVPERAAADSIEGRFRLGLEATPIVVNNTTLKDVQDTDFDGMGDDDSDVNETTIGLASGLGATLGYGLSESIALGARLQLLMRGADRESDSKSSATTVLLMPYLMFVSGEETDSLRFTIAGTVGYGSHHAESSAETDFGSGPITFESSQTASGLVLGATVGMLAFTFDRFSIDPSVFLFYETGSISFETDEPPDPEDVDYTATTFGISVTFSGWFGGRAAEVEPPQPSYSRGYGSSLPAPRESDADTFAATPAPPRASEPAVLSTRTTLDSAIFMLLGSPQQRREEVALRIQRYAPAGEAACAALDVEIDGVVVRTVPLKQQVRDDHGVQELTVQGSIDLALAAQMTKSSNTKLRWCGNERTLSLVARDGISRFIADMRGRLDTLPPPAAAPAPAPAAEPAPATTPAPAPSGATAPAPTPTPAAPSPY